MPTVATVRCLTTAALLLLAAAAPARAQGPDSPLPTECACEHETLFDRLGLDRLRLRSVGVSVGAVKPAQTRATTLYSIQADYGEIIPRLHVGFNATWWGSRFTSRTTDKFAQRLRAAIDDTAATVSVGRITVSDISLGTDFRFLPLPSATLRPHVGAGIAVHVINAEGDIIRDTFVERALDNITAGLAGFAGADLHLGSRLTVGGQARFDLVSGTRFGAIRLGGAYVFGAARPVSESSERGGS